MQKEAQVMLSESSNIKGGGELHYTSKEIKGK